MREKIIQVLWVENDPMITQAYPREADMREGIEIVPFSCWEDAEEALEAAYSRWIPSLWMLSVVTVEVMQTKQLVF